MLDVYVAFGCENKGHRFRNDNKLRMYKRQAYY